jgi:hypothetical protein
MIFAKQTKLDIIIDVGSSIQDHEIVEIRFQKPNNKRGKFIGSVDDAELGRIKYEVQSPADIDLAGIWIFWAYIKYQSGKEIKSEPVKIRIYDEGQLKTR